MELVSRELAPSSPFFFVNRFDLAVERYSNIFYSTWGLLLGGLVFALPMMHMRIEDHTTDMFDDEDGYSSSAPPRSDTWEE